MKLISIEMGRAIQRFVPDEIRPVRGTYIQEMIRLISERYNFGLLPTTPQSLQHGAKFQQGRLVSGDKIINIAEMVLHNDAIVVSTTLTTEDADFVLQDVINWSRSAFGMRDPITPFSRIFESHVVVEFDGVIENVVNAYSHVTKEFGDALNSLYKLDVEPKFSRITFSVDDSSMPLLRNDFWIERRAGAPYSQNRYFSACGLQTAQHLRLLEVFEGTSKPKKK